MSNTTGTMEAIDKKELITKDLMTVPNAISFCRVILITPFVAFFVAKMYVAATITIALSGLSDCFDGLIARKYHQESEFGKIIDPLADKLTLLAAGICIVMIEPIALPLMGLMVVKDLLMITGGVIVVKKGIIPPKSAWYGKVGTILFYITIGVIVLMAVFGYVNKPLTITLLCVTLFVEVFSLINYAVVFFRLMKGKEASSEK